MEKPTFVIGLSGYSAGRALALRTPTGLPKSSTSAVESSFLSTQRTKPLPPPKTLDEAGIRAWLGANITPNGWAIIGFDDRHAVFGSPNGITIQTDGLVHTDIRTEGFGGTSFDGFVSRSNQQAWLIDCQARKFRVLRMSIFAANNLQGDSRTAQNNEAPWIPPVPDTTDGFVIDKICQMVSHAPAPPDDGAK